MASNNAARSPPFGGTTPPRGLFNDDAAPRLFDRHFRCSLVSQRMNVPSEEGAELQRLYGEYTEGTARAAAALLAGDSQGFREEDDKVGLIVRRIREIFGTTGHWSG